MNEGRNITTNYGNWVSTRIIAIPIALAVILAILSVVSPYFKIPTCIFVIVSVYFLYARWLFSPKGRNLQERVRTLVLEHLHWDGNGRALDIGCGNAALAIGLATKYSKATVVGIDPWEKTWEYSQKVCQANAVQEGVSDRVAFQRASASSLPFKDGHFDAVVSNFVFHEVRDSKDKVGLIKEALRVLRNGGKFTFQDLFYIQQLYGDTSELLQTIKSWGISKVEYIDTRSLEFIPWALKLPFMLGTVGILTGEK